MQSREEEEKEDLESVNRKKTAEDAFLETSSQHYGIVLFIHGYGPLLVLFQMISKDGEELGILGLISQFRFIILFKY